MHEAHISRYAGWQPTPPLSITQGEPPRRVVPLHNIYRLAKLTRDLHQILGLPVRLQKRPPHGPPHRGVRSQQLLHLRGHLLGPGARERDRRVLLGAWHLCGRPPHHHPLQCQGQGVPMCAGLGRQQLQLHLLRLYDTDMNIGCDIFATAVHLSSPFCFSSF